MCVHIDLYHHNSAIDQSNQKLRATWSQFPPLLCRGPLQQRSFTSIHEAPARRSGRYGGGQA